MTHNPIQYPYLPEGRSIKYVERSNLYMIEAEKARNELATDKKHSTGAVVVLDGKIVGRAGNQSGFKHPKLIEWHEKFLCIRRALKIKSGQKYWACPGCAKNKNHAEALAVNDARKTLGRDPIGADLYLHGHWWCCKPCWDEMISGGINDVYLLEGSELMFK